MLVTGMNAEFEQTKRDMQKVSEFNNQLANLVGRSISKKFGENA